MSSHGKSTENGTRAKSYQARRQENLERSTQPLLKQRYMCVWRCWILDVSGNT